MARFITLGWAIDRPCPLCGVPLEYGTIDATGAGSSHREIMGWYCSECKLSVADAIYKRSSKDVPPTPEELLFLLLGGNDDEAK